MNSLQLFFSQNLGAVTIGSAILGFLVGFRMVRALWGALDAPKGSEGSSASSWVITGMLVSLALALIIFSRDPIQLFLIEVIGGFYLAGAGIGLLFCLRQPCSELADFEHWASKPAGSGQVDPHIDPRGTAAALSGPKATTLQLAAPPKALTYLPAPAADSGAEPRASSGIRRWHW